MSTQLPPPEGSPVMVEEKPKKEKAPKKEKGVVTGDPAEYPSHSPVKPSANLLPSYIRERRANDKTMQIAIYSSLAALALILAAVGATFFYALAAQSERDEAQDMRNQAQMEANRLSPIADYYDGLVERQNAASEKMRGDLDYAKMFDAINRAAQGEVEVTNITFAGEAPCAGPNPFETSNAIGCIHMTAKPAGGDIAGFVANLNANSDFSSAHSETVIGDSNGSKVTVNYSGSALTMRFVSPDEQEAVAQQIQEEVNGTEGAAQ